MENPKCISDLFYKDLTGFSLRRAYFLQLEHGPLGFFPAIYEIDTCTEQERKEMIICLDLTLLEEVRAMLTERKSKITEFLLLVNPDGTLGFEIRGKHSSKTEYESANPAPILTRERFNALVVKNPKPFRWAPGFVGDDTTHEESAETLAAAAK